MLPLPDYPTWIQTLLTNQKLSDRELMQLALAVACGSAENGGGPFGSIISDNGKLVAIGWNSVVANSDSTAHAEINSLRQAQKALKTHDLSKHADLKLFCTTAPCIQCFGAIYWSGLKQVFSGADKSVPESLGFDEGPVFQDLWNYASKHKAISYQSSFQPDLDYEQPFRVYRKKGKVIY